MSFDDTLANVNLLVALNRIRLQTQSPNSKFLTKYAKQLRPCTTSLQRNTAWPLNHPTSSLQEQRSTSELHTHDLAAQFSFCFRHRVPRHTENKIVKNTQLPESKKLRIWKNTRTEQWVPTIEAVPFFSTAKEAQHEEPQSFKERSNFGGVAAQDYSRHYWWAPHAARQTFHPKI